MTIEEACDDLAGHLRDDATFIFAGIGKHGGVPAILLYFRKGKKASITASVGRFVRTWKGFPVAIRKTARPKPGLADPLPVRTKPV